MGCFSVVLFFLDSCWLGWSLLAISGWGRRLSKISSGMVTLFSFAALRSSTFASSPRPFVINQRADSGTNLKCYRYKVGLVRPVTNVTKQSSSIIPNVFSNARFFLVYIWRFFFSPSHRNFSCSFQFFCILLIWLIVVALFDDISSWHGVQFFDNYWKLIGKHVDMEDNTHGWILSTLLAFSWRT